MVARWTKGPRAITVSLLVVAAAAVVSSACTHLLGVEEGFSVYVPDASGVDYLDVANLAADAGDARDGADAADVGSPPCAPRSTMECAEDPSGSAIAGLSTPARGTCRLGTRTCGEDHTWGPCLGAVGPTPRDCESPADGDCDGKPDDTIDQVCECNAAHPTRTINGGPKNCECLETCTLDHRWNVCTPPVTCECNPGDTRTCTGPNGCAGGTQTCDGNRTWGSCLGAPANATYCIDHDGDSACAASTPCTLACAGTLGPEWKVGCAPTDCDDGDASNKPASPPACTPSNDCHAGALHCAPSGNACVDTGASRPDRSTCGAAGVCDRGTCGVCVTGDHGCVGSTGTTPRTCVGGQWKDGSACGGPTPLCAAGACRAEPPSCQGSGKGTGFDCGASGTADCCGTGLPIPGGKFVLDVTDSHIPGAISAARMDRFEVTVGRFRKFVNAVTSAAGWNPAAGSGKHAHLNGGKGVGDVAGSGYETGWDASWTLPTIASEWDTNLSGTEATWTPNAGANENRPINNITWFEAYAFCIWDGGFLPTTAEWLYAAEGGNEQRFYPWSIPATSTVIDDSYAVYCGGSCNGTQNVGAKSARGDGKWLHSDLAGNVYEWQLDFGSGGIASSVCLDCATLTPSASRASFGGSYDRDADAQGYTRGQQSTPGFRQALMGARCGRAP